MNNNVFIPPLKPHQPTPYKKGCSQQREYDELTVYGDKHKFPAITTYCDYVDKKGKFVEKYLLRVKWISWEEYWFGLCERKSLRLYKTFKGCAYNGQRYDLSHVTWISRKEYNEQTR